jgi:hypothetical protein
MGNQCPGAGNGAKVQGAIAELTELNDVSPWLSGTGVLASAASRISSFYTDGQLRWRTFAVGTRFVDSKVTGARYATSALRASFQLGRTKWQV